jgi:hypothetical protein
MEREGYQRLRQMLPASDWLAVIEQHFPGAGATVQQATARTLPPSALVLAALLGTVPAPVLSFLFTHHSAQTQAPPTPASVFEPSMQRRSQVQLQSPRHRLSTGEPSRPALAIRACVVRPGELLNTGETASAVDEGTRRTLLRQLLNAHNPTRTLENLIPGTPWNAPALPAWEYVGGAGREVDTFNRGDVADVTACGYSASVRILTGFSSVTGGPAAPRHLPAIMGTVDLQLHLRDGRLLTLIELRDLLVDAVAVVPLTQKAAAALLPTGPFEEGELGLWIASNSARGLEDVIDLGQAAPGTSPQTEVELHSDLQSWATDRGIGVSSADCASEATRLAIELLRRCFQRTNRQDYERLLRPLLP